MLDLFSRCPQLHALGTLNAAQSKLTTQIGSNAPHGSDIIPSLKVGDTVTMHNGFEGTATPSLVERVAAKGLDNIRREHVAAAIYWVLRANECESAEKMDDLLSDAGMTVADHPHLLIELDIAYRIVHLLFSDFFATDYFSSNLFASWLVALAPRSEVLMIERPWNMHDKNHPEPVADEGFQLNKRHFILALHNKVWYFVSS